MNRATSTNQVSPSAVRDPRIPKFSYPLLVVAGASLAVMVFTVTPIIVGGIALVAFLGLATIKVREFPLIGYWALVSFVSLTTLDSQFRIQLGQFPIGLTELGAFLLLLGCLVHTRREGVRLSLGPIQFGLLMFLAYSAFSFVLGVMHGYPFYSLLIDVRVLVYLYLGYWASLVLLPINTKPKVFLLMGIVATLGFAIQQAVVSARSFSAAPSQAVINQRDIGVPFFTGRYGILLSAGVLQNEGLLATWWALPSLIVGLTAMTLSFVRTGWLATGIGLLALVAVGGKTWRMVRYACVLGLAALFLAVVFPQIGAISGLVGVRIADIFSPASAATDTVAARVAESEQALAALKGPLDWLTGVGLGLNVASPLSGNQHNSFVWILSKQGAIGLALFLATFAIAPIVMALRATGRMASIPRMLVVAMLSAHVSNLVSGYASGHLTLWVYCPIVGMTAGWLTSLPRFVGTSGGEVALESA